MDQSVRERGPSKDRASTANREGPLGLSEGQLGHLPRPNDPHTETLWKARQRRNLEVESAILHEGFMPLLTKPVQAY